MKLHADFDTQVLCHTDGMPWVNSPIPGVDRRMLDRIGDEVTRATSIVRYAPGSAFSPHVHGGGEEFLVLDGVFQDEHGDFPAGTYVRNPPTSSHTPASVEGCTIFVKLWQFDPDDRHQMRTDMNTAAMAPLTDQPGIGVSELFSDARETVTVEAWEADATRTLRDGGGAELLLLSGSATLAGGEELVANSWLRVPANAPVALTAGPIGARAWLKTGHLPFAQAPAV